MLLSTFGGYGLYWLILRTCGVARMSSLLYLTPPVTLLSSALLFGDPSGASTEQSTHPARLYTPPNGEQGDTRRTRR